jgi:hypothetical protein
MPLVAKSQLEDRPTAGGKKGDMEIATARDGSSDVTEHLARETPDGFA